MERMRTMLTDDGEVDVAESELGQFEEEARTAGINYRPAGRVRVGEETMTVADDERATFEEETAAAGVAWEPVHTVRAGGESVQVPQSLAGDFVKEYREAPQFAEERKARALEVAEKIDAQRPWEDRLGPVAAGVVTFAKEQVNPLSETATPMANRLAGAANVGRAVARAPLTLAEKGMDAVGFAARGVEMLAGEHGKSGFREALETAKGGMAAWREKYMGDVGDTADWGVTFGASAANAVAEAFMTAGLATGARMLSGAKPLAGAAENAGKLRAVWQAIKAPSAQSVLYGASQAEQTAAKGEKSGAEKWKQMLAGGVSGAAEMALESVSQVFGLQGQARDALKGSIERAVRQRIANVLGEGTTEGLQQLKTGAIEKLIKFDEKTWGQIGMETAQSAALGLVSAGAGEAGHAATLGMEEGRSSKVREFESSKVGETGRGPEGDGTLNAQGGMGRGPEGDGTLNAQRSTLNAQGEMGETRREFPPERKDGAVAQGVEERKGKGGKPVTGVKLLMPDGKVTWSADPGEVAMAEYWLKDRMMFPPNPKGDAGRQAGDPAVNAGRRAGFDVTPGKSVLVIVGRSRKSYPAKVVEVLDDTHVRVRIAKTARALKNNREGYADLDVRQLMQYKSAEVKAGQEEELRKAGLNLAERAQARKDAAEFARLLEGGDEFLDQRALAAAEMLTGRAAGVAKSEELHKAYVRAAAALEAEGDLASPLERARALPKLREYLGRVNKSLVIGQESENRQPDTPEEVWLARFRAEAEAERDALEDVPFALDSMTPAELEADRMRVESAQERVAQRKELERRAAAGVSGTAGDMTGTLPGMEGNSDVPLFTENGGGRTEDRGPIPQEMWMNVAPGAGEERRTEAVNEDSYTRDAFGKNSAPYITGQEPVYRGLGSFETKKKRVDNGLTFWTPDRKIAEVYSKRKGEGQGIIVQAHLMGHYLDLTDNAVIWRLRNEMARAGYGKKVADLLSERELTIMSTTNDQEHELAWRAISEYLSKRMFGIQGVIFLDQHFAGGGYEKTYASFDRAAVSEDAPVMANVAPGAGEAPVGAAGGRVVSGPVAGVYNNDLSAGVNGDGRASVAPAADGRGGIGMELKDLVLYYRMMRNALPKIREKLRGDKVLGWFRPGHNDVELLAKIFGLVDQGDTDRIRVKLAERGMTPEDVEKQLPREIEALVAVRRTQPQKRPIKVLAHEISHMIDFMPDSMVRGRGNVLGHIAALKKYLRGAIAESPTGALPLTAAEKAGLRKAAKGEIDAFIAKQMPAVRETVKEDAAVREMKVTAEDILSLMQERAGKDTPELYTWFAAQDSGVKREVMEKALKGLVSERLAAGQSAQAAAVATGRQLVSGIGGRVNERFRELLRKETEARRLIELETIKAEARASIPQWRGVAGPMEEYFNRPEEMFAELYGMFLADPAWMEQHNPVTFRALAGWMEARPEAKRAYAEWRKAKQSGAVERVHVARLTEPWEAAASDDLRKLMADVAAPSLGQKVEAFRFYFDRRMGPVYMGVKRAYGKGMDVVDRAVADGTLAETAAARQRRQLGVRRNAIFARVKDVLHGDNSIRQMLVDVQGRVKGLLDGASLDWMQLAEYAFHLRVVNELDGRAAPGGWAPDTSGKRLTAIEAGLGPERFGALRQAWLNYRTIYEQAALLHPGVRQMFGDELHDLLLKNVNYVAFAHVPTPEEVKRLTEERERAMSGAEGWETAEDAAQTFDLVHAELARRYGKAGAKIYELKGSFDPIADPLSATIGKAAAMIKAAKLNTLKRELHDYMRDTGYTGFREARSTERGGKTVVEEVDTANEKTVYWMDGGKLRGYVTSRWVAEAFEGSKADQVPFLAGAMALNRGLTAWCTRLRIPFAEVAYEKDKQSTVANVKGFYRSPLAVVPGLGWMPLAGFTRMVPEGAARALPRWLWNEKHLEWYEAQARRVAILIERGDFEEQLKRASEMEAAGRRKLAARMREDVFWARGALEKNLLMTMSDLVVPGKGLSDYDRHLAKYGLKLEGRKQAETFAGRMTQFWQTWADKYTRVSEIRENTTKIATFMFLDTQTSLSEDDKKLTVHELGGSPDFLERGMASGYIEFILRPFINAGKEATARSFKAAKDHPGDWALKKMMYTVGPAVSGWLLMSGGGLALLKHLMPDDEEREANPLYKFVQWATQKAGYVSDYLNKFYHVIPLPIDVGPGASVVLTIPMDETEQKFKQFVVTALDSLAGMAGVDTAKDPDAWTHLGAQVWGQFLPDVNVSSPLLGMIAPWMNTAQGNNTYDAFRQRNLLSDDELAGRFSNADAVETLLGETWNRSGLGGATVPYKKAPPFESELVPGEWFLNMPVIGPALGRFIRVVRNGATQNIKVINSDDDAQKVSTRLDARDLFIRNKREGRLYSHEVFRRIEENKYFADYYNGLVERYNKEYSKDAYMDAMMKSDNPDTIARYRKRMDALMK